MAFAISRMKTDITPKGPAIIGVSEIENRTVLEDIVKDPQLKELNYQIIHHDSPDLRKFAKASLVRFLFRSYEGNQDFEIEAWNRHWLAKTIDTDQEYTIKGSYDAEGHCLNLISMKPGPIPSEKAIVPVYSLPSFL